MLPINRPSIQSAVAFRSAGALQGVELHPSLTVPARFPIILLLVGAWLSLVERSVRDREVGGSNPLAPTNQFNDRTAANIGGRYSCVADLWQKL